MSEYKRPTVASLLSRWLRCWRAASQQLIDPATLADAKLESTLTNENNKKLRSLIADLKSHVKLALPCELTRQNRHVYAGLPPTSNDHSIPDGETELETFQGDTHIANRKDQATEYQVEQLLLHFKRKAGQRRYEAKKSSKKQRRKSLAGDAGMLMFCKVRDRGPGVGGPRPRA